VNEMTKKSALMMWVGLILMLLGGVLLLLWWIQYQYMMASAGTLFAGTVIAFIGVILWLAGAFRGEN
jgi:hypothetical protein